MLANIKYEKSQIDLSESLQAVNEVVCSIRKKINYIIAHPQNSSVYEHSMLECIYGILSSQSHLLKYVSHYAKGPDEIDEVNETQNMVNKTCVGLKQLFPIIN